MTELKDGIRTFYARSRKEWRKWLEKNHQSHERVWLIMYKKESQIPTVNYPEAVEEALCFGWIDSKANKRDDQSYFQFFAKRNPRSKWSKINKERVDKLIKQQLMSAAGLETIETAKENGAWTALEDIDNVIIPQDLQIALNKNKSANKNFASFPKSSVKIILEWIKNAKKQETRSKRIDETVMLAAKGIRANHYQNK